MLSTDFRIRAAQERMRLLSALDTSLGARMDRFSLNAFEICVLKFLKLPGIEKGILRIVFAFMDHCHTGSAIVGAPLPAFDVRFQKKFLPAIDRRSFVFLRVLSTTASFAGMHESVAFQDYVHVDTMFVELRALLAQNGVLLPEERPDERYRGDGYPFRIVVFSPGPSAGPGGGTTGAGSRTAVEVGRAPLEPSVVIVPPIPGLPIKYDTTLERLVRGLEKMLGNGNPARKSSNTSRIDLQSGAAELYGLPHGTCVLNLQLNQNLPKVECGVCKLRCRRVEVMYDLAAGTGVAASTSSASTARSAGTTESSMTLFQERIQDGLILYRLHGKYQCGRCWQKTLGIKAAGLLKQRQHEKEQAAAAASASTERQKSHHAHTGTKDAPPDGVGQDTETSSKSNTTSPPAASRR
mmetsp:Transcript_9471/g.23257  ORF Transcript_9471/g.23257 Transcript_9471/m.23257 type:complete len:409 (-) Transcript_9471:344-1570(-)